MTTARLLASAAFLLAATAALAQPGPPPGDGPPPGGFPNMPTMAGTSYTAALTVTDGALAGPADPALTGRATATLGDGLALTSSRDALNGVIVAGGKSAFTLRGSRIALSGPGTNDFLGTGAGVLVRDHATLVLDGVTIATSARIASAAVAAEEATLRIYNSHLTANGGPLPPGYKPVIGPGMMEPPAPLGLEGTARTLLAMSNSRTFIDHSTIEADGWGAVSTDATGGKLYVQVDDSTIRVRRKGYGVYADFGAHVVVGRTRIDTGGPMGIIAGKARVDFTKVTGRAASNVMMIHSVMAFDPTETAEFTLTGAEVASTGPALLVKGANARIVLTGGSVTSASGVLLDVRRNDDPNATRTKGAKVPGVALTLKDARLAGDVIDTDPDRATVLVLDGARLTGALGDVTLQADATSRWTARAASRVVLAPGTPLSAIDAPAGVTVTVRSADLPVGERALPGGGKLVVTR